MAIPSTSQDPGHEADVRRYLESAMRPWLERMGFTVAVHPNPEAGFGPILTAERIEDPSLPTVLTYGHGDTVRGLEDQWESGLSPWTMTDRGDRWYGRGTADNKGQHALNLTALETVLAERGGRLGFNVRAAAGNLGGARLDRAARFRRAREGRAQGRRADRERRAARRCGDAHDLLRHARLVQLRSFDRAAGPAACIPAIGAG